MNIEAIKNGYVIDHISAGNAMKIYDLLELDKLECQVALITNAKSKKSGKKDIIKIDKVIDIDFDKIAFIDANVTINVVKNDVIIEKKKLTIPEKVVNIVSCKNPRCITSIEKNLDQVFVLTDNDKKEYRCMYCDNLLGK